MTEMQTPTEAPTTQTEGAPQRLDLRSLRKWLSGEIDIRVPRGWLVAGAAAFAVLLIVAFD